MQTESLGLKYKSLILPVHRNKRTFFSHILAKLWHFGENFWQSSTSNSSFPGSREVKLVISRMILVWHVCYCVIMEVIILMCNIAEHSQSDIISIIFEFIMWHLAYQKSRLVKICSNSYWTLDKCQTRNMFISKQYSLADNFTLLSVYYTEKGDV